MASNGIIRPIHELFAKIYQTERESLESQQKIRDGEYHAFTFIFSQKADKHDKDEHPTNQAKHV